MVRSYQSSTKKYFRLLFVFVCFIYFTLFYRNIIFHNISLFFSVLSQDQPTVIKKTMDCTLLKEKRQTRRVSDECRVKIEHKKEVRKNSMNEDIQLIEYFFYWFLIQYSFTWHFYLVTDKCSTKSLLGYFWHISSTAPLDILTL